jgi:hypothetical protein
MRGPAEDNDEPPTPFRWDDDDDRDHQGFDD